MSQYKRIFIIGHPGIGKGLFAKTLAEKLGWQFIDADFGLEFHIGRTMKAILGEQGEEAFQHCQTEILNLYLQKENIVAATDASIICTEKNRQLLSSEFVVYLKASTPVQLERTARNPAPLIPTTDIKTFLDTLHNERDGLYEQVGRISIDSDDSELEKHVLNVVKVVSAAKDSKQASDQVKLDEKDFIIYHKTRHIPVHLTDQQALCLKLLAQGKTSKEIGRELNISYRTVEGYVAKTMEQLGCTSSKELIALYFDQP